MLSKAQKVAFLEWTDVWLKAKVTRDKKIVRKIEKLFKELRRLEKEADKTIDPELKKEMKRAKAKLDKIKN